MNQQSAMNNLQMAHGQVEIVEDAGGGSRELSLTKTKIEEAMYWLARDMRKQGIYFDTDDIFSP